MKKSFDSVQWMRDRRRQIDEEDRNLTWVEKRRKTHEIVMRDPLLGSLCRRVSRPGVSRSLTARDGSATYGQSLGGTRAPRRARKRGK